ncbi:MAG: hypothetical protein BJ554DRAFT_1641, partial [Olpidium bornovanus]
MCYAAHQNRVAERNYDVKRINEELAVGGEPPSKPGGLVFNRSDRNTINHLRASERFEYVFWMGDLNYRVYGTRPIIDNLLSTRRLEVLLANDQLTIERRAGRVFSGFGEAQIHFLPTYKFDVVPAKQVTPTDRSDQQQLAEDSQYNIVEAGVVDKQQRDGRSSVMMMTVVREDDGKVIGHLKGADDESDDEESLLAPAWSGDQGGVRLGDQREKRPTRLPAPGFKDPPAGKSKDAAIAGRRKGPQSTPVPLPRKPVRPVGPAPAVGRKPTKKRHLAVPRKVDIPRRDQLGKAFEHQLALRASPAFLGLPIVSATAPTTPATSSAASSDVYDSSVKARIPSWTDRILYRSRVKRQEIGVGGETAAAEQDGGERHWGNGAVHPYFYDALMEMTCSDHKPVVGVFGVDFDWEAVKDFGSIPEWAVRKISH